jgi:hypothetical protein
LSPCWAVLLSSLITIPLDGLSNTPRLSDPDGGRKTKMSGPDSFQAALCLWICAT